MADEFPARYGEADWSLIPEHCRDGLRRHIEQGCPVGDFLTAVLSSDLVEAFVRADDVNAQRLADYVKFLVRYAPRGSFGSRAVVNAWQDAGGLLGGAR